MGDGDHSSGDEQPAKAPTVIDLGELSKMKDVAQGAAESSERLQAVYERLSAAQDLRSTHGGIESLVAQSKHMSRIIEQATAGLEFSSLVNDSGGVSTYSATSCIFEDIELRQRLLAGGVTERLAHAAMGMSPLIPSTMVENLAFSSDHTGVPCLGETVRLAAAASAVDLDRFEMPDLSAISALSRSVESLIRPSFNLPALDIQEMLSGLHSPWLDTANVLGSAEALVRVQSLGLQLQQQTAFNPDYSALLRETLGDWRDVMAIPAGLEEQPARSAFYVDLGFDTRIIDRPDEAFDETLTLAGIAFQPENNEVEGRHDDAGLSRARQLHAVVQRLETELRTFIVVVLSEEFGSQWFKHLPNNLYGKWVGKQQCDPRGHTLDPIDYADFTDFEQIICKRDLFRKVFAAHFVSLESVRESLMRLRAPRNAAMHSRPIGRDDAMLAAFETRRLMLCVIRH